MKPILIWPSTALLFVLTTATGFSDEISQGDVLNTVNELNSVQLPVFEKGKFAGYQEMPLEPDRAPSAEQAGESIRMQDSENISSPASITTDANTSNGEE